MSALIVDEAMLREPRLLTPGMKPLGPVKVDWSHPIPSQYGLIRCFLFRNQDTNLGENLTNQTMYFHDLVNNRMVPFTVCNYPIYFKRYFDSNGPYFINTYGDSGPQIGGLANDIGIVELAALNQYSIVSNMYFNNTVAFSYFIQVNNIFELTVTSNGTQVTIRAINASSWTDGKDEVFSVAIQVLKPYFFATTYAGYIDTRDVYFDKLKATRTNFTGSLSSTNGSLVMLQNRLGCSYLFVFKKYMPQDIVESLRYDPYQFLIPA